MFTGASALAAALAIEDKANGKVVTFDVSDTHLELARTHWKMAGVDHMIDFKAPPYFALILVQSTVVPAIYIVPLGNRCPTS